MVLLPSLSITDEEGMAKTLDRKVEVARRIYDFGIEAGMPPS
ncbi:MAG: hypothetical protein R3C24_02515 [Cyanobacteriota/Melainabacteria group bacterium]